MKKIKLLLSLTSLIIILLSACKKDDFVEIVGVCPVVVSTNPLDGATSVPLNQVISAKFNTRLQPASINYLSFTLLGSTPVTGIVAYVDSTATFTPNIPLNPNTTYVGRLSTLVTDITGNVMQADYVWTFSTGLTLSPMVISTSPLNLSSNVAINKTITASFSFPMNPLSINASTFLVRQGTTAVTGTVTYSGRTASFTPTVNLAPNAAYTATITIGASNLVGIPLDNSYAWSFDTGSN